MMPILTPVPMPTVPGLRSAGGSGLDAIWCEASVIPYASSTGAPNRDSSWCIVSGDSADELERMNLSFSAPGGRSPRLRISSIWCIVGTAEYQVAPWSWTVGQNVRGSNFGGTTTVPPERNVAIVEAMRPWMWNSGMTQSATSLGASP